MNYYEDYYWLNEDSLKFLQKDYLSEGQDAQERYAQIAQRAEELLGIDGFADEFLGYIKKGYYSLSSPVVSNFGTNKGLPISCNGSFIDDTIESILGKVAEVGTMTKYGAGTSGYFGAIRGRGAPISIGGTSTGSVHFAQMFNTTINVVSQGSIRRGSFAGYWPIDHPDIEEVLEIREEGNPIQNISLGLTITDKWMSEMIAGDSAKRKIWARVLKKKAETGYPYLLFSDTVNRNAPQVYKDLGLTIWASNLCTEICLPSSSLWAFVCNLASLNLLHWDAIEANPRIIRCLLYFQDAVTTEYIQKTDGIRFLEPANKFAREHRAVGMGVLGWHSYLQSKMIPFESFEAKMENVKIFKKIKEQCDVANHELAEAYGEPEILKGYGLRMTTTMAVAPTTSSSFILGQVSPSIEPLDSNYFVKALAKGKFTYKNPFLKKVLADYGKDNLETWNSILQRGGSVQHLTFLSEKEKAVFKTFSEISQKEILIQAAARQKYIDQAQSINLKISTDTPVKEVNQLMIFAWESGIKTLYYQRGVNPAQQLSRNLLECVSCES